MRRAGFPAGFLVHDREGVELKLVDGGRRIRSPRTAQRYLGAQHALRDRDGFVDTGDMVERRGDRYVFAGRRGGIINVGGLKIDPEEIEAVINRHPQVRMSLVRPKQNPITGSIVIAVRRAESRLRALRWRAANQERHIAALPATCCRATKSRGHLDRAGARRRRDRKIDAAPWLKRHAPFWSPAPAAGSGLASPASWPMPVMT